MPRLYHGVTTLPAGPASTHPVASPRLPPPTMHLVFRKIVLLVSALALTIVAFAFSLRKSDDGPVAPRAAPSPAIVVLDGIAGLPSTVAELPAADADAFRSLMDELRGTPVVVNLWASWCEPCKREMPRLASAAGEHHDVQFVGVSSLDSREGAESFIAELSVPFPSLFDPDGAIRTELAGVGLPVTVFFDAEGTQIAKIDGELSQSVLDAQLAAIAG